MSVSSKWMFSEGAESSVRGSLLKEAEEERGIGSSFWEEKEEEGVISIAPVRLFSREGRGELLSSKLLARGALEPLRTGRLGGVPFAGGVLEIGVGGLAETEGGLGVTRGDFLRGAPFKTAFTIAEGGGVEERKEVEEAGREGGGGVGDPVRGESGMARAGDVSGTLRAGPS